MALPTSSDTINRAVRLSSPGTTCQGASGVAVEASACS